MSNDISIVGAGLAGCSIAWQLHFRGVGFNLLEDKPDVAGSLVAAGMLAPVTGKAFNPSWRIEEFYDSAREFYAKVEQILGKKLWYEYPVVRLFFDAKDRAKFEKKREENSALNDWVEKVVDNVPNTISTEGAVVWKGSGRLDVKTFVEASRSFFLNQPSVETSQKIYTTGARGLIDQNPLPLPHRSAKGEILTVRIPDLRQDQIISRGTWLVPTGNNDQTFLCGANYDWDELDNKPTLSGREIVEKGLRSLTGLPYSVIDHVAGVRPIIRRSEPVLGKIGDGFFLNGLGSKGTLYAPRATEYLLDMILAGKAAPEYLQYP